MASVINKKIDPDAVGAANGTSWADAYTSLNVALSTEAKNIVTADEQWDFECRSSGGTADITAVNIDLWTTDSTRYIRIFATTGDKALKSGWDASKYRISVTDANVFIIKENYVRVEDIQIESIYVAASFKYIFGATNLTAAANEIRISGCRVRSTGGTMHGANISDTNTILKIWNCIFSPISGRGLIVDCATAAIYNTIVAKCGAQGIEMDSGDWTIKNCAIFDTSNDFQDDTGGGSITIDYCASDDNDGTNNVAESGGGANWPNDFNDAANGDFTLLGGSNLRDAGAANPSGGLYTTDIEGDTYTAAGYSLGVDEYVAVSGNPKGVLGMPFARAFAGCFGGM